MMASSIPGDSASQLIFGHIFGPQRKFVTIGNMKIYVVKNDLKNEQVDVIVCNVDRSLNLSHGLVSSSLDEASGNMLQKECIMNYPNGIKNWEIAVINACSLSCQKVFFISLPKWATGNNQEIRMVMHKCLQMAEKYKHKSMAITALVTGYLGCLAETVAKTMFDCAEDFSKNPAPKYLQSVIIVVHPSDEETWKKFKSEARRRSSALSSGNHLVVQSLIYSNSAVPSYYNDESSDSEEDEAVGKWNSRNPQIDEVVRNWHPMNPQNDKDGDSTSISVKKPMRDNLLRILSSPQSSRPSKVYNVGTIAVKIYLGNLATWRADVLVSVGPLDLNLKKGSLSSSVLKIAELELQQECDKKYPDGIQYGKVAVTNGYKLNCKKVYHGALPEWDDTSDKKVLGIFIDSCLRLAHTYGMQSIAFPALGTGDLKYPARYSARAIHTCVENFAKNNPTSSLIKLDIVIFNEGSYWSRIFQDFEDEFATSDSSSQPVRFRVPREPQECHSPSIHKDYFVRMYKSDTYPPRYWTHYNNSKSTKQWNADTKEPTKPMLIPVDENTLNDIRKVVEKTWQKQFVGQGKDAEGLQELNYTKIDVNKVERIENIDVYEKYAHHRQTIFKKASKQGPITPFDDIKCLKKGPLMTTAQISSTSVLAKDIHPEINEHYLFHGTKEDVVYSLASQGLDDRLAQNTMLGKGIYCAESSTKADQYADDKQNRSDGMKKMFLVRACLGHVLIETKTKAYSRPPCRTCKQEKCTIHGNAFYDCVVGEGSWNFREFVFYDGANVYPEYLISYKRV